MPEVTDTPPSFVATPGAPPPKEHWKVKQKREREEAEAAAKAAAPAAQVVIEPPALAPKMPEMPVGGWPGDTPPTITGPSVEPATVAPPIEPASVLPFPVFAERYFLTNMIRPTAYEAPKMIRSVAADCVSAYHAYCYTIALGHGIAAKSPEAKRFGGVLSIANDLAKAVAQMDREMDGR